MCSRLSGCTPFTCGRTAQHKLFLNKLFPVPEAPYEQVWFSDTDDYLAILADAVDGEKDMGVDKDWPARFLLPLMAHNPSCRYVLASDCVDDARACKDAVERDLMREASRINDVVMERAAAYMKEGMTEREVADYIVAQYAAEGCDSTAFLPIVSYGAHAADPHHEADQTRLKAGDCIVIDMGCRKNRYCSDMTRTFFCRTADPKYAAIHDLVREANELAESMLRPGVPLCDLDKAARDHIAAAGYGEYFTHRLGHFIGQTEHEKGDVSATNAAGGQAGHDLLHRARRVPARRVRRPGGGPGAGDGGRLRDPEPRGQALEDRGLSLQAESREDGLSSRLFARFPGGNFQWAVL